MAKYRSIKIQPLEISENTREQSKIGEEMETIERLELDLNVKCRWRVSLLDNGKNDICFRSSSTVIPLIFPQSFGKDGYIGITLQDRVPSGKEQYISYWQSTSISHNPQKINFKWIQDLNVNHKTITLNTFRGLCRREYIYDKGVGEDFLNKKQNLQTINDYSKIKSFHLLKDIIKTTQKR